MLRGMKTNVPHTRALLLPFRKKIVTLAARRFPGFLPDSTDISSRANILCYSLLPAFELFPLLPLLPALLPL